MPLHYSEPQIIELAKTANDVYTIDIHIRLPRNSPSTVTYIYEAVDQDGNPKGHKPLTETVADIQADDPANFVIAYQILKERAYRKAPAAGFPAGGTIL